MPAVIPVEITTVGAKVFWAAETTAGTLPTASTAFTELVGVSSAPAIEMTPETIDVSDLSDTITQYVPGRQDPGGDASFTLIHSEAAIDAWEALVSASETALADGLRIWFEYRYPVAGVKSYYFSGRPLPLGNGGLEQNAADTIPAHVIPNGSFVWAAQPTT